jgi:hypothetical protein
MTEETWFDFQQQQEIFVLYRIPEGKAAGA